jgi:hypothetical protein
MLIAWLVYLAAVLGTLCRAGQWHMRIRRGGVGSFLAGFGKVVWSWFLGLIFAIYVLPFAVGFIRIVIRSLWK